MILSVYSVKMVFPFPENIILPLFWKSKYDLLQKNKLIDDISGIIEKEDNHPRKYGISSDKKIKDDKKVNSLRYP